MSDHAPRRSPAAAIPRYPDVRVRSHPKPLVLVSSVRYGLWRAGVASEQIGRFSREALRASSYRRQRQICARWVTLSG